MDRVEVEGLYLGRIGIPRGNEANGDGDDGDIHGWSELDADG